jgi:hypothetical protein
MKRVFSNEQGELRSGWRIAVCVILLAAVIMVINVGWRALGLPAKTVSGVLQPWAFFSFAALIAGCSFGVVAFMLRYFERLGPAAMGMPFRREALSQTFFGVLLGALPICLMVSFAILAGFGDVVLRAFDLLQLAGILVPILSAGLLLAAWEEFVMRGYVFRQLSLGISPAAAVAITGLVFGLLHSANPGASWQGVLYTVIGGVLMGWLLLKSRSLWLLIGYHFGWNATSSAIFGLDLSGFAADASIFASALTGPDILTGGEYGFEASLPAVVAEALVLSLIIFAISRRTRVRKGYERPATAALANGFNCGL